MDNYQKIELVLLFFIILLLGFIFYTGSGRELTGFFVKDEEPKTPSDFISEKDIFVDGSKVTIEVGNPVLNRYENSDSMLPFLDEKSTGVGFKPHSEEQVNVGDIISFWREGILVVHRVIEKGMDDYGTYFITKGDNNGVDDGKVRLEEIDSVLVAIIY